MDDSERTLFFVKPDGMRRGLAGECLSRLEMTGLRVVATKLMFMSEKHAKKHYAEHKGKEFFGALVAHVTSGPIMAFILEGPDAISRVRSVLGSAHAPPPGTIRGDMAKSVSLNVAHASDTPKAAASEIPLFFAESEILEWED